MPLSRALVLVVAMSTLVSSCGKDTADQHVARATAYAESSNFQEAVLEYRSALQIEPNRGDIRTKLAEAFVKTGDLAGALREYVRAADLLPGDARAQIKAGQFLLLANRFEDAKTRANNALALDAKSDQAMVLLGNAFAGLKDVEGAMSEYQEAIALNPSADSAYLSLGTIQLVKGQRDQAEATFRKAVAASPKSIPARTGLASFLWSIGRTSEAEAAMKETLVIDPDNFAANRALGVFYMSTGRIAEAEPYFKKLAEKSTAIEASLSLSDYYVAAKRPDDARRILKGLAAKPDGFGAATLRLASLEAAQNNRAEALLRVREVIAKQPKDMSARLFEARLLLIDGKRDQSLSSATSIVKEEPTSPSAAGAFMLIGAIETARERNDEAIKAYEEALRLNSQPIAAQLALATLHLTTGATEKAATYVQQALSAQPSNPLARSLLVRVELLRGDTQKAATTLAALQKEYPTAVPVLNLVAARYAVEKRFDLARAAYLKVLEVAPNDMEALGGLVNVDIESRRPREAVERMEAAMKRQAPDASLLLLAARTYFATDDLIKTEAVLKQCIDLDPNRLSAYSMLGELYGRQNRLPDAKDQFAKVVEQSPRSVGANTMLGMLLEAMRDVPAAEQQYQKTLALDPNAAIASNNLAWIYASSNRNLDQALQLAQNAVRSLPDSSSVNDTLGWVYYQKGLYSQAIRYLETSVKQAPTSVHHFHLGMAYSRNGDLDRAKASLRKALSGGNFEGAAEAKKVLAGLGG